MLLSAGVLHTSSTAGTSMLLACPPIMEDRDDTRQQAASAPLPRLFAFPDPLELRFLASQCHSSARLSVGIRAWFGALAIAAGCLFFALNTLSNRVRCACSVRNTQEHDAGVKCVSFVHAGTSVMSRGGGRACAWVCGSTASLATPRTGARTCAFALDVTRALLRPMRGVAAGSVVEG